MLSRGRIVAQGRPEELARSGGVVVETAGGTRRFPDAEREDAPRIVAELVAAGEQVYEVRSVRSTLEEAYLDAVGEQI
jgi:ABC-2 type transport system ATP-binding protein